MKKEEEILNIFKTTGAILEGHFKLSSGLHSGQYLQCAKILQYPKHAEMLCIELAEKFVNEKIDAVIAPAMGGIIVSYEVAAALKVKSLFTERVGGKMTLRRGFTLNKKDNILIVEDVVTTGLSIKEVIEVVKSSGATVVGVGCLVDRRGGKIDLGTRFESVLKLNIPVFEPQTCPFCKTNKPITKPGSRG